MRIAVVIPTRNEAERIEATLRSAQAPGVECIVSDGGSGDQTRERARALGDLSRRPGPVLGCGGGP